MDVYNSPVCQPKLKFKDIPFESTPDPSNRWVRLADLVPWEELELLSGYRNHFGSTGNPALPFRVAFGALLVQARLRITDEETVEQICENPYIQYFLGFEGCRSEKRPFDPSMMVNFRKRLEEGTLQLRKEPRRRAPLPRRETPAPKGTFILDATCAPPTSPILRTSSFSLPPGQPRRNSSTRSGRPSESRGRRSPESTGASLPGARPSPANRETSAGRNSGEPSRSRSPTLRGT